MMLCPMFALIGFAPVTPRHGAHMSPMRVSTVPPARAAVSAKIGTVAAAELSKPYDLIVIRCTRPSRPARDLMRCGQAMRRMAFVARAACVANYSMAARVGLRCCTVTPSPISLTMIHECRHRWRHNGASPVTPTRPPWRVPSEGGLTCPRLTRNSLPR